MGKWCCWQKCDTISSILFWRVKLLIWMYSVWDNGEVLECYCSLDKWIKRCFSQGSNEGVGLS